MLTSIVLSRAATGGLLVLGMPVVFGSLLSLRYPRKEAAAPTHVEAPSPREAVVIGPERLESLRAARRRHASAGDVSRAA